MSLQGLIVDFDFIFLTALGLHFGMQASLVAEHSSMWDLTSLTRD